MDKMWAGRFSKALNEKADDFNSSVHFDMRMFRQDIKGSLSHAEMLKRQGIITENDCEQITNGLVSILEDIENGTLPIDMKAEDIHMFIEGELTSRIGEAGKRLHTARSRNDQVAVDIRLYIRDEAEEIKKLLLTVINAVYTVAEKNQKTIMPGYTHLQRAQPITFAHHLLSYEMMFMRDYGRICDKSEAKRS